MSNSNAEANVIRRKVFIVENDTIGDEHWKPLIKETLLEYFNDPSYGNELVDIHISKNGNRLTTISGSWFGILCQDEARRL
jgi:hypothetical protein